MPALTTACFASSAPGCWPEVLPSACSPACWTWPTRLGCSRRAGASAPTARTCWPLYAPWRLALVTLLQFREGLSDRQAAEAVRARIDWKYLLALELADAGFDHSVLCEFRARLLAGDAAERLLARMLDVAHDAGLL